MGMTIEEAITWLNTNDFESKGFAEATSVAINTMRKYQKIKQILDDCDLEAWEVLEKIRKVAEDGSN